MKKTLILSILLALSCSVNADENTGVITQVIECSKIDNDDKRLVCYDQIKSSAHIVLPSNSNKTPPQHQEHSEFGAEKLAKSNTISREMQSVIDHVKEGVRGKKIFHLVNGQVWKQIESVRFNAVQGDTIRITKAALGSFKLSKVGSHRSIRVKRIK